jgi:hypothetical protein
MVPWIETVCAVERGDVVVAKLVGIGDALASGLRADPAQRLHNRPAGGPSGELIDESGWIHLGIVEPQDATESALQLITHHLLHGGSGSAKAVEQDDAMGDSRIRIDVVKPGPDAVQLATGSLDRAAAEDRVDHRPVSVVDDRQGKACGGGGDVSGRRDLPVDAGDVGAADIFIESAFIGERHGCGRDCGPERRGGIHHGGGLLVRDSGAQRAPIDVVVDLTAGPVDGLTKISGIEETGSGHVFGATGKSD